jgi:hypothetical protein
METIIRGYGSAKTVVIHEASRVDDGALFAAVCSMLVRSDPVQGAGLLYSPEQMVKLAAL